MDLFMPSEGLLKKISSGVKIVGSHNPLIFWETIKDQGTVLNGVFYEGMFSRIESYYDISMEDERTRLTHQRVGMVFNEGVKNILDHSLNGSNEFILGYYFGDKGICFGFYDGGDYFKNQDIKHQYENKILIDKFNQNPKGKTAHRGINGRIFPYSDFIEVDEEKGVLYCAMLKDNIIAPKGEKGNQYFYNKNNK